MTYIARIASGGDAEKRNRRILRILRMTGFVYAGGEREKRGLLFSRKGLRRRSLPASG
jgi:hypothetical protein